MRSLYKLRIKEAIVKMGKLISNLWSGICHAAAKLWRWYKSLYVGRRWYVKTCVGIVSLLLLFLIYLGMVDINFLWLFGRSPGFAQIKAPVTSEASLIYSSDGKQIGKFFNENRTPVTYDEVSPAFWQALISTEDVRFYKHHGIDVIGLGAAAKDALLRHDARGASTITQQLAKNMFRVRTQYSTGLLGKVPGIKLLIMKSKEWIIATKLELTHNKRSILTMYANTVDFGSNAFGIKTAAKTYFGCLPKDLTPDQAAILVGMLKATTYYNPKTHPENCIRRRNQVLMNMMETGSISNDEYKRYSERPITLHYSVESAYEGQALYFREAVADNLKMWCKENGIDLYADGLHIHTTLDSRMQAYAEQAARKQMKQVQRNFKNHWGNTEPWQDENHNTMPHFIEDIAKRQPVYKYLEKKFGGNTDSINAYLNKPHKVKGFDYDKGSIEMQLSTMDYIRYMVSFMHCAFVAMEPQTGHVKAYVGDIDFNSWKYDKARAMRQPGSTFKLFVYAEAINQGLTPCDKRRDEYFSMKVYDVSKKKEVTWAPTNANGYFTGDSIPLKAAFAQSINSVAVRLGQEMGIDRVAETAHAMGIKSPLDETPSLALGASDVNLIELVSAYSTVADNGQFHEPVLVEYITDRKGNEIYRAPTSSERVIPLRTAYLTQQLLLGGLREPGGTSQSLWGYVGKYADTEWGGKTGTSNNHSDAWFMGVSPRLVVGAWVGGEYRCIHFRTGQLGQGSRTALPICGYFVESVLGDPTFKKYHARFPKPDPVEVDYSDYNCSSYYGHKNDTIETDSLQFLDDDIAPMEQEEMEDELSKATESV